jgi:hypothetical protein
LALIHKELGLTQITSINVEQWQRSYMAEQEVTSLKWGKIQVGSNWGVGCEVVELVYGGTGKAIQEQGQ